MMDIQSIYEELLEHIPSMKEDPETWKKRIQAFVDARPQVVAREKFIQDLRVALVEAHAQMEPKSIRSYWFPVVSALGGIVAGGAFMFLLVTGPLQMGVEKVPSEKLLEKSTRVARMEEDTMGEEEMKVASEVEMNSMVAIEKGDADAFGEISVGSAGAVDEAMLSSRTQSGGGGGGTPTSEPAVTNMSIAAPGRGGRVNYEYTYTGSLPTLPTEALLYKKNAPDTSMIDPSFLQGFFEGRLQFEKFSDIAFQYAHWKAFIEGKEFFVNANFQDGTISMNQDYWSMMAPLCSNPQACDMKQMTEKDIPSDEKIIAVTNEFLTTMGVDTSVTLAPRVDRPWEGLPETQRYYPDTLTVFYPFNLNGLGVKETWGMGGIRVSVNVRVMNVTDATLPFLSLTESSYAVQSEQELRAVLEKGGLYGTQHNFPDSTETRALTNLRVEMRELTTYDRETETNTTYFIPALVGDVELPEGEEYVYPEEVIVPLTKNIRP